MDSTLSSIATKSTAASIATSQHRAKLISKSLHVVLDESDITHIEHAFTKATKHRMTKDELRKMLARVAKIQYEDEEFSILFMKINVNRDSFVTWDEFVSHLLLGFQEGDDRAETTSLEAPIVGPPVMYKSNHRQPVSKIIFCPAVLPDGSTSWYHGSYMSMSKDGIINYWSLDFVHERTVQSTCPELKVRPTWVTDMVCLPNVSIVCTSGTERDLRFYDTTAKKFELRVMITSLEYAVGAMCYHYTSNFDEECKLIVGDQGGHVRVIYIQPKRRGPFKSEPGTLLRHVRYEQFAKGAIKYMRVVEFKNIHTDWVRQVAYYPSLGCFISVSNCPKLAMFMSDMSRKSTYCFKVLKGIYCCDLSDTAHIIVTGGPDCMIRVWNPFVPKRPSSIFTGHHTTIISLHLQDEGKRLFSLSKDKCIKIWDVAGQTCIQNYQLLPPDLAGTTGEMATFFNPNSNQVFIGCNRIASVIVCGKLNAEETDGYTHIGPVTNVLFNTLFKCLCTCGLDSAIITWDPLSGKRLMVVKNAHSHTVHGEDLPVEITASTFDPGNQLLLTGARDGSLKTWNFNTGTCLRNMSIEPNCEVTAVVWLQYRILAIGWNRHVTEFADGGPTGGGGTSKYWDTRHTDDVLCAASRPPQALATSTYNGEMVFWRLETGQPYRRYHVGNPTGRIALRFKTESRASSKSSGRSKSSTRSSLSSSTSEGRRSLTIGKDSPKAVGADPMTMQALHARARRVSIIQVPKACIQLRSLAVHAMHFMLTRPQAAKVGALLVAVENGTVQVWSHHEAGGFLTSFSTIHTAGDYVMAMTTDKNDEFLFTGHTAGYIKTWLMKNFALPQPLQVFMPRYRIIFPFLWRDVIECRAKRAVRGQTVPVLLNSYRAHCYPIGGLLYVDETQILYSCSSDHSTRMWTLGGRYIGTLGSHREAVPITVDGQLPPDFEFRIPPDVKRIASYTTLKVFNGGKAPRTVRKKPPEILKDLTAEELDKGVYGRRLTEPILGSYFKFPPRTMNDFQVKLDNTLPSIPIYAHLVNEQPQDVKRISTPLALGDNRTGRTRACSNFSATDPKRPSKPINK